MSSIAKSVVGVVHSISTYSEHGGMGGGRDKHTHTLSPSLAFHLVCSAVP